MLRFLITIIMVLVSAVLAPASALRANDTMESWKSSSVEERAALLESLLGKRSRDAESANILKCLNETSDIPAHTDLQITDVVKACGSPKNAGQPV